MAFHVATLLSRISLWYMNFIIELSQIIFFFVIPSQQRTKGYGNSAVHG